MLGRTPTGLCPRAAGFPLNMYDLTLELTSDQWPPPHPPLTLQHQCMLLCPLCSAASTAHRTLQMGGTSDFVMVILWFWVYFSPPPSHTHIVSSELDRLQKCLSACSIFQRPFRRVSVSRVPNTHDPLQPTTRSLDVCLGETQPGSCSHSSVDERVCVDLSPSDPSRSPMFLTRALILSHKYDHLYKAKELFFVFKKNVSYTSQNSRFLKFPSGWQTFG